MLLSSGLALYRMHALQAEEAERPASPPFYPGTVDAKSEDKVRSLVVVDAVFVAVILPCSLRVQVEIAAFILERIPDSSSGSIVDDGHLVKCCQSLYD